MYTIFHLVCWEKRILMTRNLSQPLSHLSYRGVIVLNSEDKPFTPLRPIELPDFTQVTVLRALIRLLCRASSPREKLRYSEHRPLMPGRLLQTSLLYFGLYSVFSYYTQTKQFVLPTKSNVFFSTKLQQIFFSQKIKLALQTICFHLKV